MFARLRSEFPHFKVVHKSDSPLSHLIDLGLRLITLGAQRQYLTRYHTVLGYTLFLPKSWATTDEVDRVVILSHERIHLLQRQKLGMIVFAFLYLVPWLPLGLAYGRARLEWAAYRETLRATAELRGLDAARSRSLKREVVNRFLDGSYGWMWPFRKQVEDWYARLMIELEAEYGADEQARLRAMTPRQETST